MKICLFSENFPIFLHDTRDVARGHNSRAPNHCGEPKSSKNVIGTFFKTVHVLPKDLRFEHARNTRIVNLTVTTIWVRFT